MASITSNERGGGRRPVDQEITLIPFIDLLFCCIMFLLATAVWNQLARVSVDQRVPSPAGGVDAPRQLRLILQVQADGYVLASTAGDSIHIALDGAHYDDSSLDARLAERRAREPNRRDIIVAPEDGIAYAEIVRAMDVAIGNRFSQVTLSDASGL